MATVTQVRTVPEYRMELRYVPTRELLEKMKPLFDEEGQKAIDRALLEEDDKLALVGVLLHLVRPAIGNNPDLDDELLDLETQILERIDDPDYVAEMEALNEKAEVTAAVAEGLCKGMNEARDKLVSLARETIQEMGQDLKVLKEERLAFHEARAKRIGKTTERIQNLSDTQGDLMARTEAALKAASEAIETAGHVETRTDKAIGALRADLWRI